MADLWEIAVRLSSSCFTAATVGLSYEPFNPLKKKKEEKHVLLSSFSGTGVIECFCSRHLETMVLLSCFTFFGGLLDDSLNYAFASGTLLCSLIDKKWKDWRLVKNWSNPIALINIDAKYAS